MIRFFLFQLFLLMGTITLASDKQALGADSLTVSTWNIKTLSGEPYRSPIEPWGWRRNLADYDTIRSILKNLNSDVIALQEIVNRQGLKRITPSGYLNFFSERATFPYLRGSPDLFTAILASPGPEITVLDSIHVPDLAMGIIQKRKDMENNTRPGLIFTRFGTGLHIRTDNREFKLLSLHLKSGCNAKNFDASVQLDCIVLSMSLRLLNRWISKNRFWLEKLNAIVLAGDFNLVLTDEKIFTKFRDIIMNRIGSDVRMVRSPEIPERHCDLASPRARNLDYLIVISRSATVVQHSAVPVDANLVRAGMTLSDHCPLRFEVHFPD